MQDLEISQIRERVNNNPICIKEINLLIDRLESSEKAMNHWRDELRVADTELNNLRTQSPVAWNRYDSDKFIGTIYKDPGRLKPGGVTRYEPLYANSPNFVIGGDHIFPGETRPEDGQQVTYFFAPFRRWYTGTYHADGDSVFGNSGFTTWLPEVTLWVKNSGYTEKNWRPIKTLPKDNPDLPVLVFADYTDEPKDIEFTTVRELEGFSQFSHWLPAPYPPRRISEWCKCEGCIDIKKNWRISAADNFFDEDCPHIVSGIEEIERNMQKAISALADIANRSDMTLELAKKKAARIYSEIQPDEFASNKPTSAPENQEEITKPDCCFELMSDLAGVMYAAVNAGKLNEADKFRIGETEKSGTIANLLDRAEAMLAAAPQPDVSAPETNLIKSAITAIIAETRTRHAFTDDPEGVAMRDGFNKALDLVEAKLDYHKAMNSITQSPAPKAQSDRLPVECTCSLPAGIWKQCPFHGVAATKAIAEGGE